MIPTWLAVLVPAGALRYLTGQAHWAAAVLYGLAAFIGGVFLGASLAAGDMDAAFRWAMPPAVLSAVFLGSPDRWPWVPDSWSAEEESDK